MAHRQGQKHKVEIYYPALCNPSRQRPAPSSRQCPQDPERWSAATRPTRHRRTPEKSRRSPIGRGPTGGIAQAAAESPAACGSRRDPKDVLENQHRTKACRAAQATTVAPAGRPLALSVSVHGADRTIGTSESARSTRAPVRYSSQTWTRVARPQPRRQVRRQRAQAARD